ncbi:unnamed protein product [Arctogadus glacialis]
MHSVLSNQEETPETHTPELSHDATALEETGRRGEPPKESSSQRGSLSRLLRGAGALRLSLSGRRLRLPVIQVVLPFPLPPPDLLYLLHPFLSSVHRHQMPAPMPAPPSPASSQNKPLTLPPPITALHAHGHISDGQ